MSFLNRVTKENLPMYKDGFIAVTEEERKEIMLEEKPSVEEMYERLFKIEKILGKNYDLNMLSELIEANKEGRVIVVPKVLYTINKWCNCDNDSSCSNCPDKIETVGEVYTSGLTKRVLCVLMSKLGGTTFLTKQEADVKLGDI